MKRTSPGSITKRVHAFQRSDNPDDLSGKAYNAKQAAHIIGKHNFFRIVSKDGM
jgi:hypothetical protein